MVIAESPELNFEINNFFFRSPLRLEDLKNDSWLNGIVTGESVQIISHRWIGSESVSIVYKHGNGNLGERMLFRSNEVELSETREGRPLGSGCGCRRFQIDS